MYCSLSYSSNESSKPKKHCGKTRFKPIEITHVSLRFVGQERAAGFVSSNGWLGSAVVLSFPLLSCAINAHRLPSSLL